MKRLIILIISAILTFNVSCQIPFPINGPILQKYKVLSANDTSKIYLSTTGTYWYTSLPKFDFNKPLYVPNLFINGDSAATREYVRSLTMVETDPIWMFDKEYYVLRTEMLDSLNSDLFPRSVNNWTGVADTFINIRYLGSGKSGFNIEANNSINAYRIGTNDGYGYLIGTNNGTALLLGNNVGTGISGLGAGKLIEYSGTGTGATIALDQSGGGLNELYTKDFGTEVYRLDADGNLTTTGTVNANKVVTDSIDGPLGSLYLGSGIVALPGEVLWLNTGLTANISYSLGHIKFTDPSINAGAETNLSDFLLVADTSTLARKTVVNDSLAAIRADIPAGGIQDSTFVSVKVNYLITDTSATPPPLVKGTSYWNEVAGTFDDVLANGVILQRGQEMPIKVQNNTGSSMANGKAAFVLNAGGEVERIALADNRYINTAYKFIGLLTNTIPHGSTGYVTISGKVHGLNTAGFIEGDPVYLTTSGDWSQTKPITAHIIRIGFCTYAHATEGIITVAPLVESSIYEKVANNNNTVTVVSDTINGIVYTGIDTTGKPDGWVPPKSWVKREIAANNSWGNIEGNLPNQTDLWAIIDTTKEWTSRTIYVSMWGDKQTPGSDTTGNGTSLLPYATLNKALSTVKDVTKATITIQIDSGSYVFDETSKYLCNRITNLNPLTNHSSNLIFLGTYKKEAYTFTYSATSVNGVFKSSYAFTTGELTGKFAGPASAPSTPIESNIGDTIFMPSTSTTANNIYTLQTNITISGPRYTTSFAAQVKFNFVNLNYSIASDLNNAWILTSSINSTATSGFGILAEYCQIQFSIFNLKYNATIAALDLRNSIITQSVINNNATRKTVGEGLNIKQNCMMSGCMISGYLRGIGAYGDMGNFKSTTATWFIFKDCGSAFSNISFPNSNINFNCSQLNLYKTDNILYTSGISSVNLSFTTLANIGSYNNFHISSSVKSFVKPEWGVNIYIPNTYPEYSQNNSYTLTDNSTDSISIGDLSYNRTIDISYTCVRNGVYRKGSMQVLNDGTNFYFDPGDFFPAENDLGITFNGVYKSGSTNTLKLKWTTTSTGFNATMNIDYRRQNF